MDSNIEKSSSKSGLESSLNIRASEKEDVPLILEFIKGIADFEKLSHLVKATEKSLMEAIFGKRPYAEVFFAELDEVRVLQFSSIISLLLRENRDFILKIFS